MLEEIVDHYFFSKKSSVMDLLKYGIGIDMAMETFDVCLSVIDLKQQVLIKSRSSLVMTKKVLTSFMYGVTKT
jgi:hypothetical protein